MSKSSKQCFWVSHRKVIDRYKNFLDMMASDNPLTKQEMRQMAEKWPDRYGFMKKFAEGINNSQ